MKNLNKTLALYLVTARYDWKEEDFLKKVEKKIKEWIHKSTLYVLQSA